MKFSWEIYDSVALDKYSSGDYDEQYVSCHIASVNVGNLCAELMAEETSLFQEGGIPIYVNVYLLGKDDGYGETESGIAYSLLDCYFTIPRTEDIEEFTSNVEEAFEKMIIENNLQDEANKPLGNWY